VRCTTPRRPSSRQKISQAEGVGQVTVAARRLPAVRVELNPMCSTSTRSGWTGAHALAAANANRPKGSVDLGDRHWQIMADDQAKKASQYVPLIVAYRNGAAVRLSEVAEVVDSVEDLRNAGIGQRPSPRCSSSSTDSRTPTSSKPRNAVRELLPLLRASIPSTINLRSCSSAPAPSARLCARSRRTLVIAIALVIMVCSCSCGSARATLIPAVAVPGSLVATFGVMYLAGFSLNNLSLMALTIATGFVVDDAIVVLENVSRHIEPE